MIGKLIGDRYEIVGRLGSGGMAHVYKAHCTYLHRPVSIKVLREEHMEDEEFLQRFQREAQAAASLSHPNLLGVYDVGEEDGLHYIVMEYVQGETLKELIRREGQLEVSHALDITAQILRALDHAHENGVIHRDIKPHNILINSEGQVKVGDFGLAKATGGSTLVHSGTVVGSAHYFSPEQARGGYTSERSDLYSVGTVLYEMVTGQVPFEGESPVAVAVKHLQEDITPPGQLNSELSPELESVIMKALAKKQVDRYQSADEFLHDVQALQRGEPVSTESDAVYETRVLSELNRSEAESGAGTGKSALSRTKRKTAQSEDNSRQLKLWVRRSLWTLLILALIGGVAFGAYQVSNWFNVPTVTVPDVEGKDVGEAFSTLEELGLEPKIIGSRFDSKVPVNHIISQSPAPETEVKAGRRIDLLQSAGPEWVTGGVPEVAGLSRRAAIVELEEVGLRAEVVEKYNREVPEGYVINQNPRAGTPVQKNTVVQLAVSLGREPVALQVPNLVGKTTTQVFDILDELGLERGAITHSKGIYPENYVLDQEPKPGATIQTGEEVELKVSLGCYNSQELTIRTESAPASTFRLQVRLIDAVSNRIIYDEEHERGPTVRVPTCWAGTRARVVVLFDGEVVAEDTLER